MYLYVTVCWKSNFTEMLWPYISIGCSLILALYPWLQLTIWLSPRLWGFSDLCLFSWCPSVPLAWSPKFTFTCKNRILILLYDDAILTKWWSSRKMTTTKLQRRTNLWRLWKYWENYGRGCSYYDFTKLSMNIWWTLITFLAFKLFACINAITIEEIYIFSCLFLITLGDMANKCW